MKAVIDTNLLIDAQTDDYHFANRIIEAVLNGKVEAYANRAMLRENRMLARRKIHDQEYQIKLERYFARVQEVPDAEIRLSVVSDPEDNKILESAVTAKVNYLITSDKHLLDLGVYEGIKIITPGGFWGEFEEETGNSWDNWIQQFLK